jgi:hypothetical protein
MSPAGLGPEMTALTRPSAIVKNRPVLSSESMLHKNYDNKCSVEKKNIINGRESQGSWRQEELIGDVSRKVTLTVT